MWRVYGHHHAPAASVHFTEVKFFTGGNRTTVVRVASSAAAAHVRQYYCDAWSFMPLPDKYALVTDKGIISIKNKQTEGQRFAAGT